MSVEIETSLPANVLALVEQTPIEDLLLPQLREALDPVPVQSLIKMPQTFPFVMIRDTGAWGEWDGDPRFTDSSTLTVHTFCSGLNADADAGMLAEAVRVALRSTVNRVVPSLGYVIHQRMVGAPRRVTDWATATGPVQFADLPSGVQRYESSYVIGTRKPASSPFLPRP